MRAESNYGPARPAEPLGWLRDQERLHAIGYSLAITCSANALA